MSEPRVERRPVAILAADVAGYSRLMGTDEEGTLAALKAIRREVGDPKIADHRYAHMGRLDDAREVVTRLRAVASLVIPDARRFRNPEHRELFLSGLRLAAGETT
jgi:class 3 adenylate cyclase